MLMCFLQNDGYTLHYGSTDKDMQHRAVKLVKHAYKLSGRSMSSFLQEGEKLQDHLPGVACPQANLISPSITTSK